MNCFEGSVFENICMAFTALGTVGATIVALYFSYRENRVNYKITENIIIDKSTNECNVGYGIDIVNKSLNKNIMLKQSIFVELPKKKYLPLSVNPNLPKDYITPEVLAPGYNFTFFVSKEQINNILEHVKTRKVTIFFSDNLNKKYKKKIKEKK